jgi:hypothetical protein
MPGEWALACGNGHLYVGEVGEVIHITGETR